MGVVEPFQFSATACARMSFDAIAPHYRWIEAVTAGNLLQRCRTAFIHELNGAGNILLIGEGRGRFLAELLTTNPNASITCVDSSRRMLNLTRASLQRSGRSCDRVQFENADLLRWNGSEKLYDAVASHFFLDCFRPEQLERIVATVAACSAAGARWLLSDFCVPDSGWQRVRSRLILAALYEFFRLFTQLPASRLTSPDCCLRRAGFRLQARRYFNFGLLHSDVWQNEEAGRV